MSALASLVRAYERMATRQEVPSFGYSQQNIGFLIALNPDGTLAGPPIDLRSGDGRKRLPMSMAVPQPVKRTSGVAPNFLWDKSAYVLGVTASQSKRTADEHAAFIAKHEDWLAGTQDEGLLAVLAFLHAWMPEQFVANGWSEEIKDQNIVFALESQRLDRAGQSGEGVGDKCLKC
jgi:CRISPR-associated protein Csd1